MALEPLNERLSLPLLSIRVQFPNLFCCGIYMSITPAEISGIFDIIYFG
jgi:hypothetical protein